MDISGLKQRRWRIILLSVILVTVASVLCVLLASPCPRGMSLVSDASTAYCIDTYEEVSHEGEYVSRAGLQIATLGPSWNEARAVCKKKGGWLCTSQQWEDACDGRVGPGGRKFPYGDQFQGKLCNTPPGEDSTAETPPFGVHEWYKGTLTGALPDCVSRFGVHDMSGNSFEWADPGLAGSSGEAITDKRGGSFYSGGSLVNSCGNSFKGHEASFRGTITFRCCAQPRRRELSNPRSWLSGSAP